MIQDDLIEIAKTKVSIPDLWQILKLEGTPSKLCSSPWREDKHPSLSIFSNGRAFKDHGDGSGGDAICFLEKACGISRKEAVLKFLEIAGLRKSDGSQTHQSYEPAKTEKVESLKPRLRPQIPTLSSGSPEQHRQLADMRNVSLKAVQRMVESEFLFFCQYFGDVCWLVTDKERINAQVRKLSGEKFGEIKAKTILGSWAKWPIGIGESGDRVLLVEGGPDFLAAHDEILSPEWSPVCMLGSSIDIHPAAIPLFGGKEVCIVPHNDAPGRRARDNWTNQLSKTAKKVWFRELPGEVNDLNDFVTLERQKSAGGA
jgi:hypothetical protein